MQTSPYNLQSAGKLCVVMGSGQIASQGGHWLSWERVWEAQVRQESQPELEGRLDKSALSGSEGGRLSHPHHLHKDVAVLNLSYRVQQRH